MPAHLCDRRSEIYRLPAGERATIQANQDALFRELTVQQRQEMFQEVGQLYMDQRNRLLRYRDYTGQSATPDSDGELSELLAAIVVGNPGWCRKGKDGGIDLVAHDIMAQNPTYQTALSITRDGEGELINPERPTIQVKKAFRLDPMIDFRMKGRVSADGRSILVHDLSPQFNSRHAAVVNYPPRDHNIQPLKIVDGERLIVDAPLWRLASGQPLVYDEDEGLWKFNLARGYNANSEPYSDLEEFTFDLKGERGHINMSSNTADGLRDLFRSQPVIVHTHHDRRARPVIAVFIVRPTEDEMTECINGINNYSRCSTIACDYYRRGFARNTVNCPGCNRLNKVAFQPYLFKPDDSAREALSPRYHQMGARLVAHGHLGRDGFVVDLFDTEDGLSIGPNQPGETMLLRLADEDLCPDVSIRPLDEEQRDPGFFARTCIAEFYQSMIPYLDSTNMTRNIIASNLAEHLQTLVYGGIGMRTDAKGVDIVEVDSIPPINPPNLLSMAEVDIQLREADVKLVTGLSGDEMGVEDNSTRINLQRKKQTGWIEGRPIGHEHMLDWVSLLPVRVMHERVDGVEQLRIACFDFPEGGIQLFKDQVTAYFTGDLPLTPNNDRWLPNMQYHAGAFEQNTFGNNNHRLEWNRIFEYIHIFD